MVDLILFIHDRNLKLSDSLLVLRLLETLTSLLGLLIHARFIEGLSESKLVLVFFRVELDKLVIAKDIN